MTRQTKQAILRRLVRRMAGKCTSCNAPVGIVRDLLPEGWTLINECGVLVGPDGTCIRVATIEHLVPLAKGGSWDRSNLTLYCWSCNQSSSKFGKKIRPET